MNTIDHIRVHNLVQDSETPFPEDRRYSAHADLRRRLGFAMENIAEERPDINDAIRISTGDPDTFLKVFANNNADSTVDFAPLTTLTPEARRAIAAVLAVQLIAGGTPDVSVEMDAERIAG